VLVTYWLAGCAALASVITIESAFTSIWWATVVVARNLLIVATAFALARPAKLADVDA
jgi:hypothetical protein